MREAPLNVKRTNKNDMLVRLVAVQLAVCALLGAVIGAVYKLNRELFNELQDEFEELMSGGFDLSTGVPKLRGEPEKKTEAVKENSGAEENTNGKRTSADIGDGTASEGGDKTGVAKHEDAENAANTKNGGADGTSEPLPAGGTDLDEREAADCLNFGFYEADEIPCLPVSGTVTSGFGQRVHPIYGTDGFHSGMDIAAPKGTPVLAALDGTVCEAGRAESAGNYVKLSHDGGLYTLYCHMDSLNTQKGVKLRKGDVVGFVGETGLATGPHLHFEVHRSSEKLDPSFLLEKAVAPD